MNAVVAMFLLCWCWFLLGVGFHRELQQDEARRNMWRWAFVTLATAIPTVLFAMRIAKEMKP